MTNSAQLLARLVSRLPGMAYRCLHDAEWTLEFVSDGSFDLLGYTPADLMDERKVAVSDLIHPDDLAMVSLEVETALSEQRPFSMTYRMSTATGEEKHISELGGGIVRPDGSLEALEGFLWDVTDQVKAQVALRDAQRRENLGKLASGIAHDFNNLLTTLYGTADLLLLSASEDDRSAIRSLITVADKSQELTQQLFHLARPSPAAREGVDLGRILDSQRALLSELTGPSTLELDFEIGATLVVIDPRRFEQIVINLVGNARDAIDGAGRITVELKTSEEHALLEVRDNGAGMPRELQQRVFDPFFTTKGPERGTGLGLSIVKDAVDDAGGRIEVESELEKGTCFRVLLPLHSKAVPIDLPHPRLIGSEVILLAEDDDLVRQLMSRSLRRLGYTILVAADGREALRLSGRHKGPIDLLLTDARMPGLSGVELATAIREARPASLRVLLTGDSEVPPDGLFQAVMRKPIRLEPFSKQLRSLLDERSHA